MRNISFFDMAPSFKAREAHRCLKNRLGIVHARDGGLLDHPYVPRHPSSSPPTEEHQMGLLTYYCHQTKSCGQSILSLYCCTEVHISLMSVLMGVLENINISIIELESSSVTPKLGVGRGN